jgi:hypothetical protein
MILEFKRDLKKGFNNDYIIYLLIWLYSYPSDM